MGLYRHVGSHRHGRSDLKQPARSTSWGPGGSAYLSVSKVSLSSRPEQDEFVYARSNKRFSCYIKAFNKNLCVSNPNPSPQELSRGILSASYITVMPTTDCLVVEDCLLIDCLLIEDCPLQTDSLWKTAFLYEPQLLTRACGVCRHPSTTTFLMAKASDPCVADREGAKMAIHYASLYGHWACVQVRTRAPTVLVIPSDVVDINLYA